MKECGRFHLFVCIVLPSYTAKRRGSPSQEDLALRQQKGEEKEKVPFRVSTSISQCDPPWRSWLWSCSWDKLLPLLSL